MKFQICYPRTFGKSETGRQHVEKFLRENPGTTVVCPGRDGKVETITAQKGSGDDRV